LTKRLKKLQAEDPLGIWKHLNAMRQFPLTCMYRQRPPASLQVVSISVKVPDVDFWLMHRSRLQFGLTILTKAKGMRLKWLSRDET